MSTGRVTLPIENGIDDKVLRVASLWGADAVRNSDGTSLPPIAKELDAKVYETYFVGRGDNEWAHAHPADRPQFFLMSERKPALNSGPLEIRVMEGYLDLQVEPATEADREKFWQVIDRTTGETLPASAWSLAGTGADALVTVSAPEEGHVYTVDFLAWQNWDPVQMYNYITNHWENEPDRVREQPYDIRHPETWEYVKAGMDSWLESHPEVDVVRFTTFFYQFTLLFNDRQKEKMVEWFGYLGSVSEAALRDFEAKYGYALTPEDFVDEGYYNSAFRVPRKQFLDWIDSLGDFVTERARVLVEKTHAAGKEAMMFLGDHWIGTEPYCDKFASIGLDAVVGSVGSATTCRMISDIPGVKYHEGRFLPYFFPDVFFDGADPVPELNLRWSQARRAIVRSPLDRMGYGGYLSLPLKFPKFIERVGEITEEFRSLHEVSGGARPANASVKVAVLNAWGKRRSWMASMVAHAKPYMQTYAYEGVLEALAGLPFDVQFINFDDVLNGALEQVDVVINAGGAGTAFSGGSYWARPEIAAALRNFVAKGGGLIGIGEPSAVDVPGSGAYFQLSDVYGVDRERGFSLSTDRYVDVVESHFILEGLDDGPSRGRGLEEINALEVEPQPLPGRDQALVDVGPGVGFVVPVCRDTEVLQFIDGSVDLAARDFGNGRVVYLAGLPYNDINSRILFRAIYWAGHAEDRVAENYLSADPRLEVAYYPEARKLFVYNNCTQNVESSLSGEHYMNVKVNASDSVWIDV
ncbi:MAG: 1,3-beta-galactosyl-N-acetylhexosamine phosphorylase [Mobiluncus sp.]|uniref:1,3-beta-galactosyl-N-acetylhexosamine phosphorylase n=1 Tax=Mobiluncus sp. TaxID=47293 RepID=UPI00258E0197|nr:1,3-beta-galactosyl-N-acetylhexosamine phosphorylase [Mobiluncus sp.]MCI6584607.1 1,3-beta-galactosyl-N-acetylhexosamine phosphorylase [Mobiluncus sp.]